MLSAFSYLAVFYNYEVPLMNKQQKPLIDKVAEALKQVDARPAGVSPEQVRESNNKGKAFKVYSPTLGVTIKKSRRVRAGRDYGSAHNVISNGKIATHAAKSVARGVRWNDLQLAGLKVDNDQIFHGIGFGCEEKCDEYLARTDRDQYVRWEVIKEHRGTKETKVKDLEPYEPFIIYWFDRA